MSAEREAEVLRAWRAAGEDAEGDPAMLKLSCPWELSEWQLMACGGFDQDTRYFAWE